jgi:predicted pyridoxine 5'-phosphate oxidase superfamily flavin-nucleotide-binding protein
VTEISANRGRARINDAMRADMDNAVLCWLATVDADGVPNVTPKEIFAPYGEDTILIADIASTNSVRNVSAHPKVCVSFVDVFRQKGFKVAGTARLVAPGDADFAALSAPLVVMTGGAFPIRTVIAVGVEKVSRIWAPSYSLFPERSDEERMDAAYRAYGVRPEPEYP